MWLRLLQAFASQIFLVHAHVMTKSTCRYDEVGYNHSALGCGASHAVSGKSLIQAAKSISSNKLASASEIHGKTCRKLKGRHYVSGSQAPLNEAGYQQTAQLCCHHEMSMFVQREIARQGFDICDVADLHGFTTWYDCVNDTKTYAEMQAELAVANSNNCPWLGHLPNCPQKGPNCFDFGNCTKVPPDDAQQGSSAALSQAGYVAVAKMCCHVEMEQFVLREIERQNLYVCDEGALQGFLHWYDCTDDGSTQTYAKMQDELQIFTGKNGGLAPCPWLGVKGQACPKKGWNCPWVEGRYDPGAHRRRTACR